MGLAMGIKQWCSECGKEMGFHNHETNTDKQIPKHDKDMTSELPESTKKKFITAYKHLEVAVDYFVKHVYSDPKNEEGKRQLNNIIEFFDIEYKRLLSQQREQILSEVRGEVEKENQFYDEVAKIIEKPISEVPPQLLRAWSEYKKCLPSLQLKETKER